jgi:hypothetical protein
MPSKTQFMKELDFMLFKLEAEHGGSDYANISINYLKNLIAEVQKSCSICLEDYKNIADEDLYITRCNHLFHTQCIHTWSAEHNICPTCRGQLN